MLRHLSEQGYEAIAGVHGVGAPQQGQSSIILDVTDAGALRETLAKVRPDEIYHLAGLTRPGKDAIEEFYRVNLNGALNLLEAVRESAPEARVLLVGSAYAYGRVDHPISETEPLKPVNHYGVSKASADMLGLAYALEGLSVTRARPFNHSGPDQSPDFLLPSLVQQFRKIRSGEQDPVISLGNLDSVRDFSDVRDVVRGYRLALQRGRPGEAYNLGSGRGVSVRELFDLVSREAGVEAEVQIEQSRVRATDIPFLVADVSKVREELGWEPEIPLSSTIKDMLEEG